MNSFRFRIIMIGIVLAGAYSSCRKTDQAALIQDTANRTERFFTRNASYDPFIQSLADYVKRENSKYKFVEAIISKIGYPQWDKAMVLSGEVARLSGITTADSVHITCIPFVRDSQQYVNATLALATAPGDTSVKILCDWQYRDTAATGLSKSRFALTMMTLDQAVFGNRLYRLTDTTIFDNNVRYVKLNPAQNNKSASYGSSSLLEWVYTYTLCWTEYVPINNGQVTGCAPGPDCPFYTEEQSCIEISWSSGGGGGGTGGGTGGGGGGSGGGSGGGWVPPSNPNPCPGVAARTQVPAGCGVGWVPGGGGLPQTEPIDSNQIKNIYIAIKDSANHYYNKSDDDSAEWAFTITRRNGIISIKKPKTDNLPDDVTPDLYIPSIDTVLGFWHAHQGNVPWRNMNLSFSPGDFWYVYRQLRKTNSVVFATTKDFVYALVITDAQKYKTWLDGHGMLVNDRLNFLYNAGELTCPSGCSTPRLNELGVISIAGHSSISGVKIYKTPRTNLNFTQLN